MTDQQQSPNHGLTFTAEMDALGVPKGLGVWYEAGGNVSGLELTVFRNAIARRVAERTTEPMGPDLADPYQPADGLPPAIQEKLTRSHGIGVTVADILLDEQAREARV